MEKGPAAMLKYRPAIPSDIQRVIHLHVSISQSAYAHILPEAYLSEVVPSEKQALWETRFAALSSPDHLIFVASDGGPAAGFCCFAFSEEPEFGTYLHNLYVAPSHQGQGLAKALLRHTISAFDPMRKDRPVHLRAFVKNTRATALYDRLGGVVIERIGVAHAGNPVVEMVRYQWSTAHDFLEKLAG